jgi:hypothetical protein
MAAGIGAPTIITWMLNQVYRAEERCAFQLWPHIQFSNFLFGESQYRIEETSLSRDRVRATGSFEP